MKTVDIKGREYVLVNDRLKYFRENFAGYRLISEILSDHDGIVTIKASILNEKGEVLATGHAQETEGSTFINKTSHVENCETSAWGRALANFGIGIDSAVASAEEVANAIKNQDRPKGAKYKESVCAKEQTINKNDLEELLMDCNEINEVISIWWLLTKEQQNDQEIKEWFSMRKSQLKEAA